MSNELLVVYNICGINGNDIDRVDYYVESINSILNQDFEHPINLCVSSCLNSDRVIGILQDHFFDSVDICRIQEVVPVNVSFNKSVQECVKKYGKFASYVYIDSGIKLDDKKTLQSLWIAYKNYNFEMISTNVDNDSGFDHWKINIEHNLDCNIVPLGKAINLHCQLFGAKIFDIFDNRIIPDLFSAFCTESSFSFICAALKSKWAILPNIMTFHNRSMDGPSSGFVNRHDMVFRLNKTMNDIIYSKESIESGYGYEEYRGLLMHDKSKFDNNGYAIDNKLLNFIANSLYLPKYILNYETIKGNFLNKQ